MAEHQKVLYSQLEAGYEFPPASYKLDSAMVAAYLEAVEETGNLYRDNKLIPPMAVGAHAMAALAEGISLPAGTIHVSQEFEFKDAVSIEDTLTSHARVTRKQDRGNLHLLTIDLNVFNQHQKEVLNAKTSFLLP